MKIIDLLNKIAKGEEVPKKIIYLPDATNNEYAGEYSYKYGDYLKDGWSNMWLFKDHIKAKLNDEIKIIEEEKEIEEIPYHYNFEYIDCGDLKREVVEELSKNFNYFKDKINELVRELNKIKKEGK